MYGNRMASDELNGRAITADAEWLAHRYDAVGDAIHFVRVTRGDHRTATFLTDEYLGQRPPLALSRTAMRAAAVPAAPLHFIFHSAFCCSTLVARAFDLPGRAMGLKEPAILNDLVGWRQRGAEPRQLAAVLDGALALLARPFAAGEAVVVKPSNLVNTLAPAIMAMRPEARALLLHAPLRTYLGSVARKGMDGRLWVRDLLVKQARDGAVRFNFGAEDLLALTDLQAAALGWLNQQALFGELVERLGPRVRTSDSDRLLGDPHTAMSALFAHFGMPLDRDAVAAVVGGPAFNRHSKRAHEAFDTDARAAEQQRDLLFADEIEKVAVWAEAVAERFGVPMQLPRGLN